MLQAAIHPGFATWFRTVSMADDTQIATRWVGVEAAAEAISVEECDDLLRLVFDAKKQASAAFVAKLVDLLQDEDGGLDSSAARAVRVLAASVLIRLFDTDPTFPLAVVTASFEGARKVDLPMDLVGLARNSVLSWSGKAEARPSITQRQAISVDIKLTQEKVDEEGWEVAAFNDLKRVIDQANKILNNRIYEATEILDRRIKSSDQELQMLWWLVGERSLDLDLPFNKVDPGAKPLVFGRELAESTHNSPGPAAVQALLTRGGVKASGSGPVTDAVNAVTDEWVAKTVPAEGSALLTPLTYAIFRRGETGVGPAWTAGWSAVTGISADFAISPLKVAMQFYRENVLLKTLAL